jgi:hypothetical protein
MCFVAELPDGTVSAFRGERVEFLKRTAGHVVWRSTSRSGPLRLSCQGDMEFDGHLTFSMELTAERATAVNDLRLEIPLRGDVARYLMGMGRPGGLRPAEHTWRWDRNNNQDSIWLGDVNAGLRCQLFGENYRRPLINIHYRHLPLNLPPAWHNEGRGGCSVREEPDGRVVLRATSGSRTVAPDQPLHFNFALLVTPLKPLDTDGHWASRYYHAYHSPDQVVQAGANVVNIHHGNDINPYINYPFLRVDKLKQYVDEAHTKGLKVKIYYTTRELSNRTVELFALRSLGDEFGMQGSRMIGYWVPDCPVRTDHPAVLATVYRKPGKALVAIASWAQEKVNCHLTIDFAKLGLDAAHASLHALEVPGFQPPATFQPSDAIAIEPGRGWMLMTEKSQ